MKTKRILFVCTGNTCRSVMAQGLMRYALAQAGITNVQVDSAGVFAIEGMPPSGETQKLLVALGVDCAGHRARGLTAEMAEAADLMFVMEPFQAEEAIHRAPRAREKVHLLKTYGLPAAEVGGYVGIPDPIGKPLEVYETCFSEIRDATERILKSLGLCSA